MEGPGCREEKMGKGTQSRSRKGKGRGERERNILCLGDDQDCLDKV